VVVKHQWWVVVAVVGILALIPPWTGAQGAVPGSAPVPGPLPPGVQRSGTGYCLQGPVAFGNLKVAGGRCYNFYLVRTGQGSFLGVGQGGVPLVPQGGLLQFDPTVRRLLQYLIPLGVAITGLPLDTLRLTAVQFGLLDGRIMLGVPIGSRIYLLQSGELPQEHR
jgi:hypothetical protein